MFDFFLMCNFIGKAKKQFSEKYSNVSFNGSYNPAIYQPPNLYCHLGFTSDNAHGQSYMSWRNHLQGIHYHLIYKFRIFIMYNHNFVH